MVGSFHCCALGCTNDSRKQGKHLSKYPWMRNVTFHPLPTSHRRPHLRSQWLRMIKRKDFDPNRWTRVCSVHFVGGAGPTQEHPYPTLFKYNNYKGSPLPPIVYKYASDLTNHGFQEGDTVKIKVFHPNQNVSDIESDFRLKEVALEEVVVDGIHGNNGWVGAEVELGNVIAQTVIFPREGVPMPKVELVDAAPPPGMSSQNIRLPDPLYVPPVSDHEYCVAGAKSETEAHETEVQTDLTGEDIKKLYSDKLEPEENKVHNSESFLKQFPATTALQGGEPSPYLDAKQTGL